MRTSTSIVLMSFFLVACSSSHPSEPAEGRPTKQASRPSRQDPPTVEQAADQPVVVLSPPGHDPVTVRVEVARTPRETQRGLMFRRELAADAGMLFLFGRSRQQTFWMHNTLIPLDMIFITHDRRVLGVVENATPETDDPREVEGQSQFVLEVNAGFAREHGIGPGTAAQFEHVGEIPGTSDEDDEWEE